MKMSAEEFQVCAWVCVCTCVLTPTCGYLSVCGFCNHRQTTWGVGGGDLLNLCNMLTACQGPPTPQNQPFVVCGPSAAIRLSINTLRVSARVFVCVLGGYFLKILCIFKWELEQNKKVLQPPAAVSMMPLASLEGRRWKLVKQWESALLHPAPHSKTKNAIYGKYKVKN